MYHGRPFQFGVAWLILSSFLCNVVQSELVQPDKDGSPDQARRAAGPSPAGPRAV